MLSVRGEPVQVKASAPYLLLVHLPFADTALRVGAWEMDTC
jgi:hypothetical protein